MGDPRKIRKKYTGPVHPWQKKRIDEEKEIRKTYGLRTKQEIWKIQSQLTNFFDQAKKMIASRTKQTEVEKEQLLQKLAKLGLLDKNAIIDDVLGLKLDDILKRRLQTVLCEKGLAKTPKQARQFIVHGHIQIKDKKITTPSYIVRVEEESQITFVKKSKLSDESHPERATKEQVQITETVKNAEKEAEKVVKEKKEEPQKKPVEKKKETKQEETPKKESSKEDKK